MKSRIMAKRYNQTKLRKKESRTRTLLHTYVHEFQGERRDWPSLKIPHSITFENTYLSFPTATRFHDFMI